MKKRPSLLDIELFVQKRTDEKQKELKQIESESGIVDLDESLEPVKLEEEPVKFEEQDNTIKENVNENKTGSEHEEKKSGAYSNNVSTKAEHVEPDAALVDERLTSVIEITDSQRDDINKLKQDMFKLKEQLRVYHSFLSSQQKKILELEKTIAEKDLSDKNQENDKGVIDAGYLKLLLKNIVWLKEEKDFSSNDVARLFRAEGFQTPRPYESWNEKVINTLYSQAKKSFL